ncbi:DUF3833 family protein [Ancylobacter radicis]|uniref:DUF3833 family protein n=1 Tax=Ancylobacter radicis TaxID=2836179 RepID=A0ABS5R4I2_9HYPH|nr:DUF3833 family protein [Ancylobacter radicis]MBS9476559.1 DUF3833 family protein [Ancylobacter radicis]
MSLLAALALTAPAAASTAQPFTLEGYFAGASQAEGSFHAINGTSRRFSVALDGKWNGRMLTLVENFTFADGERQTKTWRFEKQADGTYRGTREDVRGDTTVTIRGNTATFNYLIDLDEGPGENLVRFHDTMTLRPDGTMLNTAWVTKYGLPVARSRVEFRRP